jgi:hypothetical protein
MVHWTFKQEIQIQINNVSFFQVCQMLMSKKVFEPVGMRNNDNSKQIFEDSGGKLYCFPAGTSNEENEPPLDDSDDDSLYDDSDIPHCSHSDTSR